MPVPNYLIFTATPPPPHPHRQKMMYLSCDTVPLKVKRFGTLDPQGGGSGGGGGEAVRGRNTISPNFNPVQVKK